MRNKMLYIGSVIIFVFAVIAFVVADVAGAWGRGDNRINFGKYDGKNIDLAIGSDYTMVVSQYEEMYRRQGIQLNESNYYYVYNNAFSETVMLRAKTGYVEKAGFDTVENPINRTLSNYYVDETQKFSTVVFNSVPEAQRNEIRDQVVLSYKMNLFDEDNYGYDIGSMKLGGLKATEKELNFIKKMGENVKSFDLAGFDTSVYPEEKVLEYAKANADLFKKYDLSIITMQKESDLKGIVKQINNNELAFNDALNTYSEKFYSDSEGKLSNSYKHRVLNILEKEEDGEKIFSGKVDEVSPIVKTKNGYSVFRTNADAVEADFTNSDILNDVRLYINANEAGLVDEYYLGMGKDFVANATTGSFDAACKHYNLTKRTLKDFQINYGSSELFSKFSSDIPELLDAPTNDNFMKIASKLKTNEVSEPIKIGKYIVVLKMTGERAADADESKENAIPDSLKKFDNTSANVAILESPKVVNNVSKAYFEHFVNN